MRYSFLSLLALATPFFPQVIASFDSITQPLQDQTFDVGSPLDIVWEPGSVTGTITINLLQGATNTTLSLGQVVASSIENSLGQYTWTVPADAAGYATYGFKISLDANTTEFQYSFPFHISATTSGEAGATGGATSTTTVKISLASTYTAAATSTSAANFSSTNPYSNTTSNATLSSTLSVKTTTSSATKTSSVAGTTTSSGAATATSKSAAATKVANGGLAIVGGLLMAFAL